MILFFKAVPAASDPLLEGVCIWNPVPDYFDPVAVVPPGHDTVGRVRVGIEFPVGGNFIIFIVVKPRVRSVGV